MSYRIATVVLCALVLAGCATPSPSSTKSGSSATSASKKPLPRFDCVFTGTGPALHRTYLLAGSFLVEQGPPKTRYKVTSDDGESIAAEHVDPATKLATGIEIDLRQHQATLTAPGRDGAAPQATAGTCTQSG